MSEPGVLGLFADPAQAAAAVRALHERGHRDVRAVMPAPFSVVVEALGYPRSRIDRITLSGAATGVAIGFAFTIGTSIAWPLVTGGKPIVSIPPFVIVAFELSVLFGATVNLLVMAITAARGRRLRAVPFDARCSDDRVGIYVADGDPAGAEETLRSFGGEEVRRA